MKYVVTESRLENLILNYLNETFDVNDINWTYMEEWDEDTDMLQEDENAILFYIGDYNGDDDGCFRWYNCDYFYSNSATRMSCPIVSLEHPYDLQLKAYFGDSWKEPFKKWFTQNFDMPVKTVD